MSENIYNRQANMNVKRDISICVIGCGGVGFNTALLVAVSGVSKLVLVDNDIIEEHNLNRLIVPYECIGMTKVTACKEMIKQLRPNIDITAYKVKFNEHLLEDCNVDWVIDCTDDYKSQNDIYQFCQNDGIKYCKGGYEGERMTIHNKVAQWDVDETDQSGYRVVSTWSAP